MSSSKKMRLKIAIIGPPKSGKASFIRNLVGKVTQNEQQPESYQVTLHKIVSGNRQYQIQLWNCGSQHMYYNKFIRNAFFKNCSAAFLMFDLSKQEQVWKAEVEEWLQEAYQFDCFLIYAIGTKGDYKSQKRQDKNFDKLSESLGNDIQIFEDTRINSFFAEYQIQHFFQNATQKMSYEIKNVFMRIENDQYKRSRGSLAIPRKMDNSLVEGTPKSKQYGNTIISIREEEIDDSKDQ